MKDHHADAVAVVGLGAIMPEAPNAPAFWDNIAGGRYCISEVEPSRWDPADYWNPDPSAPDKTYSKIGGWVRGFTFDWKRYHIPPRVLASMDEGQQWAVSIAAEALADYGYPERPLDLKRTGVVLGAAMGGELHYLTSLRIQFPAFLNALGSVPAFRELPPEMQAEILNGVAGAAGAALPPVTEDTMPGELANIIAGRVANVMGMHGPNFTTDAACASSLAALEASVGLLRKRACDAILTGGVDRNMGPTSFVKFSKIGALSATGSRPFGDGSDGFVMGEGAAMFLLKRLADAERDGDRIYAVIRGIGGSSDGRGKGITAPNPVGQEYAVRRAWEDADLDPSTAALVEAHGTSTKVGDVVEVESLGKVYSGAPRGSIALGSAKGNIGHLKAAAGAAGLLKAIQAIAHRQLPPTLNARTPNPNIDFSASPFRLNHDLAPWEPREGTPRRAAVSSYGFGGTNFHVVLEEHSPATLRPRPAAVQVVERRERSSAAQAPALFAEQLVPGVAVPATARKAPTKTPLRGVAALGAADVSGLRKQLAEMIGRAGDGSIPAVEAPPPSVLASAERLIVDFGDGAELLDRLQKAARALATDAPGAWKALQAQGIFRGSGPAAGKVAFLYTGQGSQYLNMGRALAAREPVCAAVFEEADRVTEGLLGRPLTSYFFVDVDRKDPAALKEAETALMQTAITQPAVLATDTAIDRLLRQYGFVPDVVMGHSLGEYAALVAAEVMPFAQGLEAAAARGREMASIHMEDNGCMAAVMAPPAVVESTLKTIEGYVVAANINSVAQCVIGGETAAVEAAVKAFKKAGYAAVRIQVSHAFHTRIVAPASGPLGKVLDRFEIALPSIPVVANVTGELYPATVPEIKETLQRQVASPVQWVGGLETLWRMGVRTFVEVGPRKALKGFVDDVLGDRPGAVSLGTNHPKPGEIQTFNHALCGLWAAGHGAPPTGEAPAVSAGGAQQGGSVSSSSVPTSSLDGLTQLLSQALSRLSPEGRGASDRNEVPAGSVVISGTGLGLPGAEKPLMDPANAERILRGEQFIDLIPDRHRKAMAGRRITRVVKGEDGSGRFETIENSADVIRLAGRPGPFDLSAEYGVPEKLVEALDLTSQIAMAAGLDALREAGIPLVQTFRRTTTGKDLPDRWMLPEALRDETGVVFASAFPGYDRFADELARYHEWEARKRELEGLEDLRKYIRETEGLRELQRRIAALTEELERHPYEFDRRFLFRILAMGHSQFAEYVGARGPNAQANSACASTAQAIAMAEDWIRSGRCRRVLVLGADVATSERMLPWIGSGFLASGAAATDDKVEEAALPFDRRRHGTLIGMGACALVVESQDAVEERGWRGIVELLSTETRNSAFHGTRLDVDHISSVVDSLVTSAERRFGINRHAIAPATVFMSHETFTPARGGSAAAEVAALRKTFGAAASEIVIANTKGFTGHPMGVGIEDVIAVKILEHGIVPPVPNFREVDPDLGPLTLSRGGRYPVTYAIHLAAGFGSQISLTLTRRIPGSLDRLDNRARYQAWLSEVSGYEQAETEVVKRNLRIVSQGAPRRAPVASRWTFGTGPSRRTVAGGDGRMDGVRPAPMAVPHAPPPAPVMMAAPAFEASRASSSSTPAVVPAPMAGGSAAAAPAVPSAAPPADPVVARVLAIVADKTGYPPEMLEMDLDLEADLGVDTVKQAEVFAAVREEYGIPRAESVKLRDFPTLRHVAQFVFDSRPELKAAPAASPAPAGAPSPEPPAPMAASAATVADPVVSRVLAIVADKTGYPPEMLEMDLDLEADLGVDTVKQAEVFAAVREEYGIPRAEDLKLRDFPTLQHVVGFVFDNRPDLKRGPAAAVAAAAMPAAPAAMAGAPAAMVLVPAVPAAAPDAPAPAPSVPSAAPALAPSPAPSAAAPDSDPVVLKVLEIVAEKTGYPQEMLEMDLDLEADLGVDTVKQAEVFAAVREAWSIPRAEDLKLRDFPTLRHVAQFVFDSRPDLVRGPREPDNGPPAPIEERPAVTSREEAAAASAAKPVAADLAEADRMPRRVPAPVLRPPLDLCKPTGVRIGEGSRVVVGIDRTGVAETLAGRLSTRGAEVCLLDPSLPTPEVLAHLEAFAAAGPVDGLFWLPALDAEAPLAGLDLAAFREENRRRVKVLYAAVRALVSREGAEPFLISATALDGLHGYGDGASGPLGGSVTGFTKAYKRECPGALAKAVDFVPGEGAGSIAATLLAEADRDSGAVEIGRTGDLRWAISFEERPLPIEGEAPGLSLGPDTVFVVTGAAGGITSAIVADLAAASAGTFYLLDLAPEAAPSDPRIALFRSDREALKSHLIDEARASGEKPTPVSIDRRILGIEREEAALRAVESVRAAGGTAHYRSVNLLDGPAVAAVVDEVRAAHGRVDVLVHAGGVEISRKLQEKEPAEFDLVFDIKADGFFSILRAAEGMPIGATVVFSSVAGRFGNSGQTDYSAANDLLCKWTSALRRMRPATRAIAVDWTAWGGIGMATRGSIPKIMEMAGIEMLPPEAGVPTVRRELTVAGGGGELVVGGKLGILAAEWDATGGLDLEAAGQELTGGEQPLVMLGSVKSAGLHGGLVVETALDPKVQAFLYDHAMEGTPLLPGVMGTEAFAQLATLACPGFRVGAVEDVEFQKPFKFFRMEPSTLHLSAIARPAARGEVLVGTWLHSKTQPKPELPPQVRLHFKGRVRMTREEGPLPVVPFQVPALSALPIDQEIIYRIYFHGPAYKVLERVRVDGASAIGLMAKDLLPNAVPENAAELIAPRLLELCFQTAGIWEVWAKERLALPTAFASVVRHRDPAEAKGRLYAVVEARGEEPVFDAKVVDEEGSVFLELASYRTVALPGRTTLLP